MKKGRLAGVMVATLAVLGIVGCAQSPVRQAHGPEIGLVEIYTGMTLRRMVVGNPRPKGVVLLLHGFPETLQAWKEIALALARDYEIHAFDWPGYGLSSRPSAEVFSYSPSDYARILGGYIRMAGIDTARLVIYATDIGALPALLLALREPGTARKIIVGDFAPFDRPQYMHANLQSLKSSATAEQARIRLNASRDEILSNAFRRGLPREEQFEISEEFRRDMFDGWNRPSMTSADAFYHYYSHFTRDQNYLELNLDRLKTPIKVIWGETDFYISKEMGVEFARKASAQFGLLPSVGHYPHLQRPGQTVEEIRAAFGD